MKNQLFYFFLLSFFVGITACDDDPVIVEPTCADIIDSLTINQLQIIASHNSYRLNTDQAVLNQLSVLQTMFGFEEFATEELDYTHPPLEEQFDDYGVRGIELDIYPDPDGGRYADRLVYDEDIPTVKLKMAPSGIAALDEPGFKVLHIADMDYNTNYHTLKETLTTLKNWSDAHPRHLPMFVNIETKTSGAYETIAAAGGIIALLADGVGLTPTLPFTVETMQALDAEIKEIFGEGLEQVLTPDEFKGDYATINEAVLAHDLPTIGEARGKIVFLLDGSSSTYLEAFPGLEGAVIFPYTAPGEAHTAFVIRNNSVGSQADIESLVAQGYLVRTRTDAGTHEARTGNTAPREAAFASGAQIISTDYYRPDPRHTTDTAWTDFEVQFPNGELARINPISGADVVTECLIEE